MSTEVLVKRSDKLAFYGVPDVDEETITYHRMRGFTEGNTSKNPKEYTRQYVDEDAERSDLVGFSPAMSFAFDQFVGNPVHDDMVKLSNNEVLGTDAIRTLLVIDKTDATVTGTAPNEVITYGAKKRDYTVIPDAEGNSLDAYTYSGNFKSNGDTTFGTAVIDDETNTAVFTPAV